MAPRSDAELLARSDHDPPAFAEFYRRHERAVVAFAGRLVRDPELTIDVAAETFARAYEARHQFRGDGGATARGWLLGIAKHVVYAAWRAGLRTLGLPDESGTTWAAAELTSCARTVSCAV